MKEGAPRGPADPAAVARVVPLLPAGPRAVVQLLRLTGARPSEILALRPREVDRAAETWVLRPERHKAAWRGKERAIYLGPEARAVLAPWMLGVGPDDFVFTPARSEEARNRERTERRVTPRYPSHMRRNAAKQKGRKLAPRFSRVALNLAVRRACKKAGVPPFTPYSLRHLKAVELWERYGLESVRAVLGHSYAGMSDHYSRQADRPLAERAASEAG